MSHHTFRGFTLLEIITVIFIIGLLASALYIGVVPYMMRSRDTDRTTGLFQYTSILEAYEKNYDTYPSNYGSGGNPLSVGYCLSEMYTRPDSPSLGGAGRFTTLYGGDTTSPPTDPDSARLVPGCPMPGSYLYSKLDIPPSGEVFIIGANLEIKASANYGTGGDLLNPSKTQEIINAKKGTVHNSAPDQIFIVTKLR